MPYSFRVNGWVTARCRLYGGRMHLFAAQSTPRETSLTPAHAEIEPPSGGPFGFASRFPLVQGAILAVLLCIALFPSYSLAIGALGTKLESLPLFRVLLAHELLELEFVGITAYASLVFRLKGGLITLAILSTAPILQLFVPVMRGSPLQNDVVVEKAIDTALIILMGLPFPLLFEALFRRFQAEREVAALRIVNKLKSDFLNIAAHELRTPLATIMGFSELLTSDSIKVEEREKWLQRIRSESAKLAKIVNSLLDAAQLQSGSVVIKREQVDVLQAMQRALHICSSSQRHPVVIDCPPDIPPVAGDTERVVQVLVNLLDNAIKYSPQGGQITLRARPSGENRAEVVVSVSDTGLGIPHENIAKLFHTFGRLQRDETTTIPGAGMGLYIVKTLVEMMGGRVWVESQVGAGSTFSFTLPVWGTAKTPA